MRVLLTGSRHTTLAEGAFVVFTVVTIYTQWRPVTNDEEFVLVDGDCPYGGVDVACRKWAAKTPRVRSEQHPADWDKHGKAAGPIRNQAMVDAGADLCLAFPHVDSKGTWDCIRRAANAGIRVRIYPLQGES